MARQKVSNTKLAYYIKDNDKQLLTIDDAILRMENGIVLRNHLFDVKGVEEGNYIPLKFVSSTKQACYFATKAGTTSKKGTHCLVRNSLNILHEEAKNFLVNFDGIKILFDDFLVGNEFITDIESEYAIEFIDEKTDKLLSIRPDILLKTTFMNFFIEITVTHGITKEKLNSYKAYRSSNVLDMPFVVVEIDLSDLQELVRANGYDYVKSTVEERLVYNSEFKKVIPLVGFDVNDTPFGICKRSGLPYKLVINTHADGVDNRLRNLILNSDLRNHIIIDSFIVEDDSGKRIRGVDELHSLYLTDNSCEGSLYPINCPIHKEYPMRIAMQADLSTSTRLPKGSSSQESIFFKCDLYTSKGTQLSGNPSDISLCDITMNLCNKNGKISTEFLCAGDFFSYINGDENAINRVKMCSISYQKYRNL